ncbi:MAG: hypothetical protein AAGK21_11145 [Bacteroidota bacterium]
MRRSLLLSVSLPVLLLAALSASPIPETEDSANPTATLNDLTQSFTIEIVMARGRGDIRRGTITATPQRGARPPWRGTVTSIALFGPDGWIIIESIRQTRNGGFRARGRMPSNPTAFAVLTDSGFSRIWGSPTAYGPPEGEPEEPIKPEEPGEPGGGEDGCPGVTCMDIINPWTCECDDVDPWEEDEDEDETETPEQPDGDTTKFRI